MDKNWMNRLAVIIAIVVGVTGLVVVALFIVAAAALDSIGGNK